MVAPVDRYELEAFLADHCRPAPSLYLNCRLQGYLFVSEGACDKHGGSSQRWEYCLEPYP